MDPQTRRLRALSDQGKQLFQQGLFGGYNSTTHPSQAPNTFSALYETDSEDSQEEESEEGAGTNGTKPISPRFKFRDSPNASSGVWEQVRGRTVPILRLEQEEPRQAIQYKQREEEEEAMRSSHRRNRLHVPERFASPFDLITNVSDVAHDEVDVRNKRLVGNNTKPLQFKMVKQRNEQMARRDKQRKADLNRKNGVRKSGADVEEEEWDG